MSGPSLRDVLREIDFELAQGLATRPELRRAIREVRTLHERTRAAVFGDDPAARIDLREALSRQFQINDMILAVLGEAVEAAQEARGEARRVHSYVRLALEGADAGEPEPGAAASDAPGLPAGASAAAPLRPARGAGARRGGNGAGVSTDTAPEAPHAAAHGGAAPVAWEPELDPLEPLEDDVDPEQEIEWAMKPERLWLAMDPRSPRLPLVGTILRRVRNALHTRVLIYAGQLGDKQSAVNRILGDHLLRALEVLRLHDETLDAIRLRLRRLEARLERGAGSGREPRP